MVVSVDDIAGVVIFLGVLLVFFVSFGNTLQERDNQLSSDLRLLESVREDAIQDLSVNYHRIPFQVKMDGSFSGTVSVLFDFEDRVDFNSAIVMFLDGEILPTFADNLTKEIIWTANFQNGTNDFVLLYFDNLDFEFRAPIGNVNNSLLLGTTFFFDEGGIMPFTQGNVTLNLLSYFPYRVGVQYGDSFYGEREGTRTTSSASRVSTIDVNGKISFKDLLSFVRRG